jgi:hypothetical protein
MKTPATPRALYAGGREDRNTPPYGWTPAFVRTPARGDPYPEVTVVVDVEGAT